MQFREQEYILMIAKYGGITKAAEQLHISQPALSKFLNKLEDELGVKLFKRTNKSFMITSAGELYIEKAEQILRCRDEFYLALQKYTNTKPLTLSIGIQKLRAPRLIPQIYSAFHSAFPDCSIQFTESYGSDLIRQLEDGKLDFVLCNQYETLDKYESYSLIKDQLLLITSSTKELPNTKMENLKYPVVNLNDVLDETFFLLSEKTSLRILAEKIMKSNQISIKNYKEIKHQESSLHLASMGYGLAFTLSSYLPLFHFPEPYSCYHVQQYLNLIPFSLVMKPEHFPSHLKNQLIKLLKETIEPV